MNFLPFIIKRALRHWQLLLTLIMGVALSTALLASSPLLVDTVIDLGLPRQLRAAGPLDANVRITTFANIAEVNFEDLNDELEAIVNGSFGAHIDR
ncbi:MAG: hypothetical protein GY805_23410, partial [Chloroflexi bacterium]|nr:hypothetical protein [Chloroflexota bacterium]